MKKQSSVSSVADPRTQSLLVSASKDLMPQIADMISQLDDIASGQLQVYRIALDNAEAQDVMQLVQDIFPQGSTTTRQNTTQNNPLMQRQQTMSQNFNSSGPGSGTSQIGGSSSGTRSGN